MDIVLQTHQVTNQSPIYTIDRNLYAEDPILQSWVNEATNHIKSKPCKKIKESLTTSGQYWGSYLTSDLARLANEFKPQLKNYNQKGMRIDSVEFHPAYHTLMAKSVEEGLHCSIWDDSDEVKLGVANQIRAARLYLTAQTECGHICPLTMTNASIAALSNSNDLVKSWKPQILSRKYDGNSDLFANKTGVTLGMGMTEKQGGTDVRANRTTASYNKNTKMWSLIGHKWFLSAPMSDAFLVLAQTKKGLSCFLMPRILPNGQPNGIRIERLKNKLGNSSNATCEAEFHDAQAFLVGEEKNGIATILEMVSLTRLDCAVASAGLMRAALARAVHHCRHRSVFGKNLIDQPIMTYVLADMSLDVCAATLLTLRLAYALDKAKTDQNEAMFARLMTPVVKYWVCKIAPALVYEAMECLGGNGYVEDGDMARIYREAPVNSIWEGSGNVMALDTLRVLSTEPAAFEVILTEISETLGEDSDEIVGRLSLIMEGCQSNPGMTRTLCEEIAICVSAGLLREYTTELMYDMFLFDKRDLSRRFTYGSLGKKEYDCKSVLDFVFPISD